MTNAKSVPQFGTHVGEYDDARRPQDARAAPDEHDGHEGKRIAPRLDPDGVEGDGEEVVQQHERAADEPREQADGPSTQSPPSWK